MRSAVLTSGAYSMFDDDILYLDMRGTSCDNNFYIGTTEDDDGNVLNNRNMNYRLGNIIFYSDRTTIAQKFIPCKRLSDGKVGFYEAIGKQFYCSESAVDWKAGPTAEGGNV